MPMKKTIKSFIKIGRNRISKSIEYIFKQKYRFDIGLTFLTFLNFTLLVITASEKLKSIFGIERISELIIILVPLAFFGVWFLGYFMDRFVHFHARTEQEYSKRSYVWRKNFDELNAIRAELKLMRKTSVFKPRRR